MSLFATLSDVRIISGSVSIPTYGLWAGDVTVASEEPVQDQTTLVLGNLSLVCHVYRKAIFAGTQVCRLVAGYGGWRTVIPAKQYQLFGGVPKSMVLVDAALECGEKIAITGVDIVGDAWVRENAQASRQLRLLADNWYCDPAGVTQIKAWPTTTVRSDFQVIDQDGGAGIVTVATEDYAAWLPGCQFTSPFTQGTLTNGGVSYRFDNDGTFRLQVMTTP